MKIRAGFVSNSSSASFVLPIEGLTIEQVFKILYHTEIAQKEMKENKVLNPNDYDISRWDKWDITLSGNKIFGFTTMTNFDIQHFINEIGAGKNLEYEDDN
jgi:hypothetical protein